MSEQSPVLAFHSKELVDRVHMVRVQTSQSRQDNIRDFTAYSPVNNKHIEEACRDFVINGSNGVIALEAKLAESLNEPSDYVKASDKIASDFVSRTVRPVPQTPIYEIPIDNPSRFSGYATTGLGFVATRAPRWDGDIVDEGFKAHLVHERAHTSGIATQKVVVLKEDNLNNHTNHFVTVNGQTIVDLRSGYSTTERFVIKNEFLEEAFAEETAARYRDMVHNSASHEFRGQTVMYLNQLIWLPEKYISRDETRYHFSDSALPAYLVDLISTYTGVDIYSLMINTRDPHLEAASKRKIVQTINSIQPKLYEKLRNTPYEKQSFLDTFTEVYKVLSGIDIDNLQPWNPIYAADTVNTQ